MTDKTSTDSDREHNKLKDALTDALRIEVSVMQLSVSILKGMARVIDHTAINDDSMRYSGALLGIQPVLGCLWSMFEIIQYIAGYPKYHMSESFLNSQVADLEDIVKISLVNSVKHMFRILEENGFDIIVGGQIISTSSTEGEMTKPILPDSCIGCGACCMNYDPNFGAWLTEEEYHNFSIKRPDMIKIYSKDLLTGVRMKRTADNRCIALSKDNTCTIYEDRPDLCRNFVPGCEICLTHIQRLRGCE